MSIASDPGSIPIDNDADDRSKPAEVADRATSAAGDVASTATAGAKDVAGEAATQAKVVAGEAKRQVGNVVDQTRHELAQQADAAHQPGRRWPAHVVGSGRRRWPTAAPATPARWPATSTTPGPGCRRSPTASSEGGPQGLLDDVTDFARRRPIVFLAAAGAAGFVVGRLARAGRAVQQDDGARADEPGRRPRRSDGSSAPSPTRSPSCRAARPRRSTVRSSRRCRDG